MPLLTDEQFQALYTRVERSVMRSGCSHTLSRTRAALRSMKCDAQALRTNITKIVDLGGHCDCEVLMNVSPQEWEAQRGAALTYPKIFGEVESSEFVSQMMWQSVQAVQLGFTWGEGEH
jgi:hypothetical protein